MNNEYWKKRALLIENENFKNTEYHLEQMKEQYETAKQNIQKEIDKFYADFAINNQVQLADAKRILNNNELKEFKTSLKQYMKMVEADNEELLQKINNISIKHRITRLQALEDKLGIILKELENNIVSEINDTMLDTIENAYYKNLYAIESQLGLHTDFSILNTKLIDNIITYNWSGVTYSERVWRNQTNLEQSLIDALNKNFIQGNSINQVAAEMSKALDTSYKNCTRLLRTEVNYMNNRATIESYKEKGIKKYQILATLDLRTSDVCIEQDGKVYDTDKMVVGVNCPPYHPNCRTTIIPYIEGLVRNRVARNIKTGKSEEVGDLTYKEWYAKYVENSDKLLKNKEKFDNIEQIKDEVKNVQYIDITSKFANKKKYQIKKQKYFTDNDGNEYQVDGKHVVLNPTQREIEVARMLGQSIGGKVNIVPKINKPFGIKTPDYIINGEKFDLKEISGGGKYTIQGNLKGKEKQAKNFAIDISNAKFDIGEAQRQIENIYESKHYLWLNKIVLIQNDNIIKVYKRI